MDCRKGAEEECQGRLDQKIFVLVGFIRIYSVVRFLNLQGNAREKHLDEYTVNRQGFLTISPHLTSF